MEYPPCFYRKYIGSIRVHFPASYVSLPQCNPSHSLSQSNSMQLPMKQTIVKQKSIHPCKLFQKCFKCILLLYYIILCCIILYYIILYYIVLYYIVLHYIILYFIVLYYIILHYIILYFIILYYIILHYIILYFIYCIILYYITLYFIILYYIIHYIVLYCIIYIIEIIRNHQQTYQLLSGCLNRTTPRYSNPTGVTNPPNPWTQEMACGIGVHLCLAKARGWWNPHFWGGKWLW